MDSTTAEPSQSLARIFSRVLNCDDCPWIGFIGSSWKRFWLFLNTKPYEEREKLSKKASDIKCPDFLEEFEDSKLRRPTPQPDIAKHFHTRKEEKLTNKASFHIQCTAGARTSRRALKRPRQTNNPMSEKTNATSSKSELPNSAIKDRSREESTKPQPLTDKNTRTRAFPSRKQCGAKPLLGSDVYSSEKDARFNPKLQNVKSAKFIPRNAEGKRIDPDVLFDNDLRHRIPKEKLCNNFQLKGFCEYGDGCRHNHRELSDQELAALRVLARGSQCRNGTACNDATCYSGHQCPYKPCREGTGKCTFSEEMHFDDTEVISEGEAKAV